MSPRGIEETATPLQAHWDPAILEEMQQRVMFCAEARSPDGFIGRPHRHVGLELVYCLSGEGVITVGSRTFPYAKGDLVYFDSQVAHQAQVVGDYWRWGLCFWPESFGPLLSGSEIGEIVSSVRPATDEIKVYSVPASASDSITELLYDLQREVRSREPDFEILVGLSLVRLHVLLKRLRYRTVDVGPCRAGARRRHVVSGILGFIESHLAQDISTNEIAERFHYSPSQTNRLVRQATGKSVTRYVRDRRVERARALLEVTDLNVKQVAETVGFESVPYFCRVFRSTTGLTPSSYRERRARSEGI